MNVLSLFDGMSCGQIALERAGIKYDNYYASEIDKWAIKVTQHNYPDTIQLGDIRNIKARDLPKIDLLIGGSPCFLGRTKVICENEIKNIEDVEIGDKVLTHKNSYRRVLNTGSQKKTIYKLLSQGAVETLTTDNHPYYVRTRNKKWNKTKKTHEYIFDDPTWKAVKNINKGDFVGTPIVSSNSNPYELTKEECFVLGVYIGDGHTRKDFRVSEGRPNDRHWQLIISVGSHEKDTFEEIVELKHSMYKHTKNVYRAVFSNKRLVEIAEKHCGVGARNKRFDKMLLDLPHELLEKVLEGYIFADGSCRNNVYRATTISKDLVSSMALVIAKLYKTTCSIEYTIRPKTTVIEGRTVNQQNNYTISYRKQHPKQSRAWVIDNIVWNPVKNIERTEEEKVVYNIEVEEDNSYVANNHIVHNCQGFSFAGKQLNFDDPRSKLFFEFVRLLKEVKPTYFLLENVKMKKEYEAVITEHMGVEPIFIDSEVISPLHRKRLYWTNIPILTDLNRKDVTVNDIIKGYYPNKKGKAMLASEAGQLTSELKMFHRFYSIQACNIVFKNEKHYVECKKHYDTFFGGRRAMSAKEIDLLLEDNNIDLSLYSGVRYLTQQELEACQTVPTGYTNCVDRNKAGKMLGNGWTVDVIAHIFKGIKEDK